MAGDWIKMRSNLWDDPRVAKLCDLTESGEAQIIGGLYWLWATADQHSEDGALLGLTSRSIDRKTGIKGFGDALISIGWLSGDENGVVIARFEEHNGASAKTRLQTAQRVAKHKGNAQVTQQSLPIDDLGNGETVSTALPREEKRREEKKEPKTPWAAPDWVPAEAWKDFEQMRVKRKKPLTDRARDLAVSKLAELKSAGNDPGQVIEQTVLHAWDTFYPIKHDGNAGGGINGKDARYVN